ncbi:MAG: hypothetical protein M1839_005269 [Geoglossum umbratile]|nr:MAG: hypothetical protein M1839_005269 [Geoglossum umbratile]
MPKQLHEFQRILKYSEQLVLQDSPKELLLSALEKLSKSGIQAQVQEAVAKHETAFLKKYLNMKANYQKSSVRMTKGHQGYAKLMTQDEVDEALEEYYAKQKELAEIVARKEKKEEGKGRKRSKGKEVVRDVTVPSTAPIPSGSRSGAQVSDSEGLRAILISSDTSDSEVSEASEPYITRLRKVLAAGPSRNASYTGMVTRSRARKEN